MEEGDCCDIVKILSTEKRDFLVRNNGDEVKIESLRGKTICIIFVPLHIDYCYYAERFVVLEEVHTELYPKGEFEVVFVAETEYGAGSQKMKKLKIEVEELFNNIFSKMPCLSVPFSDVQSTKQICNLLYSSLEGPVCIAILDPKGKVLARNGGEILMDYGAEGYPFTYERIKEICEEDDLAVREKLCLKTLLDSPSCDFVIRNDSEKVPISELEEKVVGLYMYGGEREPTIMQKLLEAYKELQKREEKFEIVLVNLHFYGGYSDQDSFDRNFKGMPWLALPFMDKRIRKLWRIFDNPGTVAGEEGILVIIGPGGKFVETHSSSILKYFGSDAYPFTKQKAVEIEKIRLKKVTLDSLFAIADKDYVIKRDGTQIPFSKLKGWSIILIFLYLDDKRCGKVVAKLKEWYEEMKGKDDKFEMILVPFFESKTSFDKVFPDMPWPSFAPDVQVYRVFSKILRICSGELVAFGTDGHFVTNRPLQRLQNHGADAYPFTDDDLDEEIYCELEMDLHWDFTDDDLDEEIYCELEMDLHWDF